MIKIGQKQIQTLASNSNASNFGASVSMTKLYCVSAMCVITGTSIVSGTVCLQKSNDNVNWANDGTPVTVGATGGIYFLEKTPPTSLYMRVSYQMTSGTIASTTTVVGIEQY